MKAIEKAYLKLKHYVFSNNLHGTHSPFVYEFLEKVVYKVQSEDKYSSIPHVNLFKAIQAYYSLNKVVYLGYNKALVPSDDSTITCDYDERFPELLENSAIEMVVMNKSHHMNVLTTFMNIILSSNNKPMFIIVNKIYESEQMQKAWKHFLADPKITICMDFFYFGIVVIRDGQRKENFKLRLKM